LRKVLQLKSKMGRLKYIFIILLLVSLLASSGCALFGERNSSHASGEPINPQWQPLYIDEEVGEALLASELVEKIAPTVVSIFTEKVTYDIFLRPVPETGAGSGVIVDPKGYIVTNSHVVEGAESVAVVLSDGRSFEAVNWAADSLTDLAVVQIEGEDLPFAHFLNNSLGKLEELEEVVAVGNAFALPGGPTWTKGVVSYLGRSIEMSDDVVLYDLIQTDAAINPGNSGGPLVNMAGQVVGINTAIIAGAQNIGFAISTDTAIPIVNDLVKKGLVSFAWLGVLITTVTPAIQSQYDLAIDYGALIIELVSPSPAAEAGLKSLDVIVGFGDEEIKTAEELVAAIRSHKPGDKVKIAFWHGEEEMNTEATLIQRPSP
jgi:serine protease Do